MAVIDELAEALGVSRSTLRRQSPAICRERRSYAEEDKRHAVSLHVHDGLSAAQIAKDLGVPRTTVVRWISVYAKADS